MSQIEARPVRRVGVVPVSRELLEHLLGLGPEEVITAITATVEPPSLMVTVSSPLLPDVELGCATTTIGDTEALVFDDGDNAHLVISRIKWRS